MAITNLLKKTIHPYSVYAKIYFIRSLYIVNGASPKLLLGKKVCWGKLEIPEYDEY
jgi:hypothetical protein